MGKWIFEIAEICLDAVGRIVFPPRCVLCDGLLEPMQRGIHPECKKRLIRVEEPVCMRCGRPLASEREEYCYDCSKRAKKAGGFLQGKALYLYQGEIKHSMYRLKYGNRREYARFFAEEAADGYRLWVERIKPEAVLPVPMYKRKQRRRGYNQAEVFAKALSGQLGIPMDAGVLLRTKNTKPQKLLNDEERKNNLKNAFQTRQNIVKYKRVLVVDDIYTTGSTADAVAECLIRAGITEVYFLSICIGRGN